MKIGIKSLYIDFHTHISPQFAIQNENMARGYKFRLVDSEGVLVEDESIKVYWNVSFNKKKLPDPVPAEYSNGEYTLKIPRIAVQEKGKALAQFTVIKDSQVLKSTPYEFNILQDVDLDGENVIELENQGEKLKEIIAKSEKALEEVAQNLEDMNIIQDESKELVEINKNLIEESKELIENGELLLEEANNIKIDLQNEMDKANNLSNQLETDLSKLDDRFITLEQKVDDLILSGNSMLEDGEDILRQAQEAIDAVNNAIEQGIDDEIQQIIEDKIAELSVSYTQLEDKPKLNGVELVGDISTDDLGIKAPTKVSELENDKGFITIDEVEVIEGPQGKPGEPGRDGKDGKSIEYKWKGTELGLRLEGGLFYDYVDLKGEKGDRGIPGTNGRDGLDGERGPKGDPGTTNYLELSNRPTKLSQFTNDEGYITENNNKLGKVRNIKDNSFLEIWTGTQAEYDRISNPSSAIIYVIKEG